MIFSSSDNTDLTKLECVYPTDGPGAVSPVMTHHLWMSQEAETIHWPSGENPTEDTPHQQMLTVTSRHLMSLDSRFSNIQWLFAK